MDWTLIENKDAWEKYKVKLDENGTPGWHSTTYAHEHNGIPEEYPCLVSSHWYDDPNGPYTYDHIFVYDADARKLITAVFDLKYSKSHVV